MAYPLTPKQMQRLIGNPVCFHQKQMLCRLVDELWRRGRTEPTTFDALWEASMPLLVRETMAEHEIESELIGMLTAE